MPSGKAVSSTVHANGNAGSRRFQCSNCGMHISDNVGINISLDPYVVCGHHTDLFSASSVC